MERQLFNFLHFALGLLSRAFDAIFVHHTAGSELIAGRPHTVAKLFGSPPGEYGGGLPNRRPDGMSSFLVHKTAPVRPFSATDGRKIGSIARKLNWATLTSKPTTSGQWREFPC